MHPIESLKFGQGPLWTPELLLALALLGGLILLVLLATIYMYYKRKEERFKLFSHMLAGRELSESEIRCFFRYLARKKIPLELILESEAIAKETLQHCGVNEEEGLRKLGFDTSDLVKKFLKRQQELRKKWNLR
jgi:antitoxin component of RelBE/YafQ-DinJ toxin-antitoxin module